MRSNDSQKLLVVGIPKTFDDTELSELFSTFGTIVEAKVVLDTTSNTSRGFGFVTFTAPSAMRTAIKCMNQKVIEGRTLNVRQLVPKDTFQAQKKETPDVSKRPCWLLRKGKCTKGTNCPFSHEIRTGDCGNCFEFVQTGECKHGENCKFVHPETSDIMARNQEQVETRQVQDERNGRDKKRVCYGFQNGRCHRGIKCIYAHELLASDDVGNGAEEKKERARQTESGNKRRRMEETDDYDVMQRNVEKKTLRVVGKKTEGPVLKRFEWKAKAQIEGWEKKVERDQGRELEAGQPQYQSRQIKTEKVDMGAAFDGVSDDETRSRHGGKNKVDKATMRANREKLLQDRRAKRDAKKTALSRLRVKGEIELLA
ncbi:unnamed protein product [Peronospora belbahrii]|uniref:Uncharacterized protein n=1 Tax=Peronospora belbahrii TaxID=622444 RepID=A0ABN8CSE8_9STRA|nr:unnamed protein product [Peronospora belbahrii]